MVYPETIEVSETKNIDKHANLLLTPFEFYKFIQTEGYKTVLFKHREFFVFRDGIYIETLTYEKCKTYEELATRIESLLDKGFKDATEVFEGFLFDVEDYNLYNEFKKSTFSRTACLSGNLRNLNRTDFSRDYKLFIEAKQFGNTDRRIFEEAKNVGITTFEEYDKFKNSNFYYGKPSNYDRNRIIYSARYREFVEAIKGSFNDR